MTQIKTPAEITQDAFDAYAENLTPAEREAFMLNAEGNWRSFIEDVIEADRAQRDAEVWVIQDEMGDVIDVTDNLEYAEWLTREDDDNPIRTMTEDTVWSGPEDRKDWE